MVSMTKDIMMVNTITTITTMLKMITIMNNIKMMTLGQAIMEVRDGITKITIRIMIIIRIKSMIKEDTVKTKGRMRHINRTTAMKEQIHGLVKTIWTEYLI